MGVTTIVRHGHARSSARVAVVVALVPHLTYVGTGWGPSWLDPDSLVIENLSSGGGFADWPAARSRMARIVGRRSS